MNIINHMPDREPTNLDFYGFFHGLDQNTPQTFLILVSEVPEIQEEVAKKLGDQSTWRESEPIRSAFLYFIGTVMEHVANESLFPEEKKQNQPSNVGETQGTRVAPLTDKENKEFKQLSNRVYLLFIFFIAAFILYNSFLTK